MRQLLICYRCKKLEKKLDIMKLSRKLYIVLFAFIILIIARDNLRISIPLSLFSAVTLVCSFWLDNQDRIVFPCVLLPFCRGLPYSEMLLIVIGVSCLIHFRSIKICAKYYIPILIIIIIEIFDYIKFDVSSNEILYLAIYMIFVTYVIEQRLYEGIEEKMIVLYSYSTIFSVIIVVLREIQSLGIDYIMTYNVRFGANNNELTVTNYNSNELGLYCCVAAALLLLLYSHRKNIMCFVLALTVSVIGLVSVSRTFMLVLLIVWGLYFLYEKKSVKNIILWITMIVIVILVINKFFPDISQWILNYYERRNLEASTDGFGGRTAIISKLFNNYFSSCWSILFGFSEMYSIVLQTGGAHNGLQEMLISWGIVGFIVSCGWICMLLYHFKASYRRIEWKYYTAFIIFFIFVQTIQLFTMHNYLILMMISMVAMAVGDKNTESSIY